MWTSRGYSFRIFYIKENSHQNLHLTETQKKAVRWKSFVVKKATAYGMPLLEIDGMVKLEAG